MIGDNNPEDRKTVQEFLEKDQLYKYQFFEAKCAKSVLEFCRSMRFDCILIGHSLPDMDCMEIISELAKKKSQNSLPIVLWTEEEDEALAVKIVRSGAAVDYLIKPQITTALLTKTVRYAISSLRWKNKLRQYHGKIDELIENQKKHGQQRITSAESNKFLIEDLPIGIVLIDTQGTILEVNNAALKMFAYSSREDFIGVPASALYSDPKDRDRFIELFKKDLVVNFETRFRRKNGAVFWGRVSSILRKTVEGAPLHIKTIEDITVRKKEKEQIIHKTKMLDGINRLLQKALVCDNEEDICRACLAVAEELTDSKFGILGEVNPSGLLDTLAISDPIWDACRMPGSKAMKAIKNMEIRGIDRAVIRDGKSRIVNDLSRHPDRIGLPDGHPPVTSFLGVPLKHFEKTVGMIGLGNKESEYDSTDQETIEILSLSFWEVLMRKRMEIALKNEKERFQTLVEEAPTGVSIIGENGNYKYINPTFIKMFGYTLQDIPTGREWFRRAFPDKEYRSQVISDWFSYISGTEDSMTAPLIFQVTDHEGDKKTIRFLISVMTSGDYLIIYEDISKEKKLEIQLAQAQKMEAVGRLAGGIAHDFNNLITAILGYSDFILEKLDADDPIRDDMAVIIQSANRAASLTHQLLAFSRKQILQPAILNLNNVINRLTKMLSRLIGEDIKIETVLEPVLLQVKADPGQMEQILMNLSINARDAMPHGGNLLIETANVDLDESYAKNHGVELEPGPYVMLAVSDTGIGMDEETQANIFEPFFTTKKIGKGTGLGLSTAYGLVKQMEGYIWVYSHPGQGTTFKIYLPAQDKTVTQVSEKTADLEKLMGKETILLVEDDAALLTIAKKILMRYGYNALEASDGDMAVKIVKTYEKPIHLLITDVVMPGRNGREVAEQIKTILPGIKLLFMSGYTDNLIAHHGILDAGVNFIQKPFSPVQLVVKAREILDAPETQ